METMEPGGFGWKERVLKEQDARDAEFLKNTPDHFKRQGQEYLKLMRLNVEGKVDALLTKAREGWKTGEVKRTAQRLSSSAQTNPDSAPKVREANAR